MTPTDFEPALMRIEPACRYLDVGRSKLYELIREGKLEAVKIGKSARVTTASLKRFVESLPAGTGGSPIKRERPKTSLDELGLGDEPKNAAGQRWQNNAVARSDLRLGVAIKIAKMLGAHSALGLELDEESAVLARAALRSEPETSK